MSLTDSHKLLSEDPPWSKLFPPWSLPAPCLDKDCLLCLLMNFTHMPLFPHHSALLAACRPLPLSPDATLCTITILAWVFFQTGAARVSFTSFLGPPFCSTHGLLSYTKSQAHERRADCTGTKEPRSWDLLSCIGFLWQKQALGGTWRKSLAGMQ